MIILKETRECLHFYFNRECLVCLLEEAEIFAKIETLKVSCKVFPNVNSKATLKLKMALIEVLRIS